MLVVCNRDRNVIESAFYFCIDALLMIARHIVHRKKLSIIKFNDTFKDVQVVFQAPGHWDVVILFSTRIEFDNLEYILGYDFESI